MPFELTKRSLSFPDPEDADDSGLLAIGGDLSVDRLLMAYSKGIFPWYEDGMPILWWSPDPRMVLFPGKMIISHSLRQSIRKNEFRVTFDTDFARVIEACSYVPRKDADGTWITDEMKAAYIKLHHKGYAHSVETWHDGELVGGLYGVSLGRAFFGESMFHRENNASKVALHKLVSLLRHHNFDIIDAQVYTNHLESLGGELISRRAYMKLLQGSIEKPGLTGSWSDLDKVLEEIEAKEE
jgi:leucyl/phenylalanyl-tRNA--protein transferase